MYNSANILRATLSIAFLITLFGCGDAPKTPEQVQKEQKYREMFGEEDNVLNVFALVNVYKNNPLQANEICQQSGPSIIKGFIADMGSNSLGNYIDLRNEHPRAEGITRIIKIVMGGDYGFVDAIDSNDKKPDSDTRIFLDNSNENSNAIRKIKRNDLIRIVGLCKGQIEVDGTKSKIIIGNAKILKINEEFL